MADQVGSPERLMEVTSQPRPTATLHIRDPRQSSTEAAFFYGWLDPQIIRTEEAVASADHDLLRHCFHCGISGEGVVVGRAEDMLDDGV